jgi:hypothetical protein
LNDEFECSRNPDVDNFLKTKAIPFEKKGTSRTYLILNDDGLILAYFSLSFKEVTLDTSKISKTKIQKLDGFSKNATTVKAYLIGQIGKNSKISNNPLKLNTILNEIYSVIVQAQALIGGRVIILECENNESLISLYQNHGYKLLDITDETNLKTMYVTITDIQTISGTQQ